MAPIAVDPGATRPANASPNTTTTDTKTQLPTPSTSTPSTTKPIDRSIFPDGLRTTGQHPPIYSLIRPYSAFPRSISGPTVWQPEDYAPHPERWVHHFSPSELSELSAAADAFHASGIPLTGISKSNFPLSEHLGPSLAAVRTELLDGKGFILYKGLPVNEWGNAKSAIAYLGLGVHIGYPVSQNGKGHVLGHVKDLGEDSSQIDKVRIYRTNARQFFHADDCDVVGLLCIARAEQGGESDVCSIHHVWNILQRERPDVAELLTQPVWYFDRKGEQSRGEEPYIRTSIFYLETGGGRVNERAIDEATVNEATAIDERVNEATANEATAIDEQSTPPPPPRVYCKWDPYYVRSLTRFSSTGAIPPLSAAQEEATDLLERVCNRPDVRLHMVLEVGDIQFVANSHTLHARTAYRDHAPASGMPRRHLMRLWLSTPADEGGWDLPFWDRDEKKRGGVQVDDTAPVVRLDAD